MLTTLLTTVALALPLVPQDAAVENDPKAVQLLEEFGERVYDPVAAGLESLSFDMDMPNPMMGGSMGVLSVHWKKGAETTADFEMSDSMKQMVPEAMRGQMQEQMGQVGGQIARLQTNQVVAQILEEMNVTMVGVEDGLIKVTCTPRADGDPAIRDKTLLFDDEGTLAKTVEMGPSPMGGEVENTSTMNWVEVASARGKLILASTKEDAAGMSQSSEFSHQMFGDYIFVTNIAGSAMGQSMTMTFSNFVVNGEEMAGKDLAAADTESEG